MRLLSTLFSALSILSVLVNNASCSNNSYEKSCYVRYLLQNNQLDESFNVHKTKESLSAECERAVNLTLDALRTSSKESCVVEFLSQKDIPETLLKKYLMPQLTNDGNQVIFDERFSEFRKKVVNVSVIACNNRNAFKPDIVQLMKFARDNKDSKEKELKCLETYVKKSSNSILSSDCVMAVDDFKKEFMQRVDSNVKRAFVPPNDKLIDFECGRKKMEDDKMFERFSFFVVLATTRNMTDKQIETLAKGAEGLMGHAQKNMLECLNWN